MSNYKIKVALIDPVGGHGGMDYYDFGLSYGLSKNNTEVYYFTCAKTNELIPNCLKIEKVFGDIWDYPKLLKIVYLIYAYIKTFFILRRKEIGIAHFQFFHLGIQNIIVLVIARLFRFKKILTLHDIDSFRNNEIDFLKKIGFKLIDIIIVHNTFSKRELSKKKVNAKKIRVIPHGNYLPFVQTQKFREPRLPIKLLFFGQIKQVKGLDILIHSVHKLNRETNQVHLTIAGRPSGDITDSFYSNLIDKLKLKSSITTMFRYIENHEVGDLFKNADLVVLPYRRIYQSGVLLLSMSYGRSVLCSNLDAFTEIIRHDQNGFLFQAGSDSDLAQQIEQIINNKQNLKETRENALSDLYDNHNWIKIGKLTKEVYQE